MIGWPPSTCLGSAARCLGGQFVASMEPVLRTLCGLLLLTNNLLPPKGDVLDIGAHVGRETCWYSSLDPSRTVHAVEPLETNIARMRHEIPRWQELIGAGNIEILHAGFGSRQSRLTVPRISHRDPEHNQLVLWRAENNATGMIDTESFPVYTVDKIFEHTTLAFAHIDVEGQEADLLQGARLTLARDRPWLTVEAHTNASLRGFVEREYILTNRIGKMLSNAQYATYVVNEVCGHKGCRNVLCVPSEHITRFEASDAWLLMHRAGALNRCDNVSPSLWHCLQSSIFRVRVSGYYGSLH